MYSLSTEAEQELADAAAMYLREGSAKVAERFLDEFERIARLVSVSPGLGTSTIGGRRMFPMHRFPYSLIYLHSNEGARISAVAHQHRRPGYWQGRI